MQKLHNQILQLHQAEILVQPEMLAELQFPEVYFQGEVDVVGSRDLDSKMVVSKEQNQTFVGIVQRRVTNSEIVI